MLEHNREDILDHVNLTATDKRRHYKRIVFCVTAVIIVLLSTCLYCFVDSCRTRQHIIQDNRMMAQSVELGMLEEALQIERDQSILSLAAKHGSRTSPHLLEAYINTDDVLTRISWPSNLDEKRRPEYETKASFERHLIEHRKSAEIEKNELLDEMDFYTKDVQMMMVWLCSVLTRAGYDVSWKLVAAYENVVLAAELMATERSLGAYFFANGHFDDDAQFGLYWKQVNVFESRYSKARSYSNVVPPWNVSITTGGEVLVAIIQRFRDAIQLADVIEPSLQRATDWLEKMALYNGQLITVLKRVEVAMVSSINGMASWSLIPIVLMALFMVVISLVYVLLMWMFHRNCNDFHDFSMLLLAKKNVLKRKKERSDALFCQMLPRTVAEQFTRTEGICTKSFPRVTILFTNIISFTRDLPRGLDPNRVTSLLNDIDEFFSSRIKRFNVYKVETIGETYMVVSGLPEPNKNHGIEIANMALDLLRSTAKLKLSGLPNERLHLRIGVHTGPVAAGVVYPTRPRYAVFGETVLVASHMERSGRSGTIQLSSDTYKELINSGGNYRFEVNYTLNVQGERTRTKTYFLTLPNRRVQRSVPISIQKTREPFVFDDVSTQSSSEEKSDLPSDTPEGQDDLDEPTPIGSGGSMTPPIPGSDIDIITDDVQDIVYL